MTKIHDYDIIYISIQYNFFNFLSIFIILSIFKTIKKNIQKKNLYQFYYYINYIIFFMNYKLCLTFIVNCIPYNK